MQERIDFLAAYQKATSRNYVERVVAHDKAECAAVAKRWGYDYWDGERQYGYGGYRYDGRWAPVARDIAARYGLKAGDRVLDIGCGKAFLLYEISRAVPGVEVFGLDISRYGIENAKPEVKQRLVVGTADALPWPDRSFDLVLSLNVFHNLGARRLAGAIEEAERVRRGNAWICVESYRDEREKANLLYWQLTCASFHTPEDWAWLYGQHGYKGDFGFIFFS